MKNRGAIAAGHPDTVAAAAAVLEDGGNAFDAALAALCTACVAEPVLTSLGGGGFLLARPAGADPVLYDFFVHTPKRRPPADGLDFFPIVADFGTAQQEFHIGLGSIATPGTVRGLFTVHRELGFMPMRRIVEPAMALAQDGVVINRLQAYIFDVVGKIYIANEACRARFGSAADPMTLIGEGETFFLPEFADVLDALARDGDDLFYRGEIAARIAADCRTGGGTLTGEDLAGYQVLKRTPLTRPYRDARLHTNPPPSTGGILIAFALDLLRDADLGGGPFGNVAGLVRLARSMAATNKARIDRRLGDGATLGLRAVQGGLATLPPEDRAALAERFRLPEPRLALGTALVGVATCAIDVSDGLVADLGHICAESGVAARVAADAVPLSGPARRALGGSEAVIADLVTGGDDYELLFCVPPSARGTIDTLGRSLGLVLTRIGAIERGEGVTVVDADGQPLALERAGYQHF